jgi:polyvinyl alcohol dehydrogenase (cytochrome)
MGFGMRIAIYLMGALLICACSAPTEQPDTSAEVDPSSMQAIQNAIKQKENLPGKVHFEQVCESCHGGAVQKAPHKDMIGLMTPEAILNTLSAGLMQAEAAQLSQAEKVEVAEYLAGRPIGELQTDIPMCEEPKNFDTLAPALSSNWGIGEQNGRAISAEIAGLSGQDIEQLKPKWAISFPGANRARSQPAMAGGLMFVGSHNGKVYALDQDSGCQVWAYQAAGEVRTGIVVSPWGESAPSTSLFFGDVLGNVYALDAKSGTQMWRMRADDHPNATITGTPSLQGKTLYVPVSSLEVSLAINPEYACCTFRGSVLALDTATGEQQWKTYTIDEPPTVQKQNAVGTDMIGPSGAVVWNSPSIDIERNQLYVGTGENMSSPASKTSDAIFAIDLDDGKVNWVFQGTANDAWNVACDTDTPQNCPEENGPDFDFGAATLLVTGSTVGDLVIGGQKSGVVHALNPADGSVVWQTKVGRGGIQGGIHFGMAASGDRLFVPMSDMADGRTYDDPDRPGMHAVDINSGAILWSNIHEDVCAGRSFCNPGISQVPTVIDNRVVAGAMDGIVRAYDIETGEITWQLDTTQEFATILGEPTTGGSFGGASGPIAFDGKLILSSGYGIYNHMSGNLLLVLGK